MTLDEELDRIVWARDCDDMRQIAHELAARSPR
jgi:hypothetical protein